MTFSNTCRVTINTDFDGSIVSFDDSNYRMSYDGSYNVSET